MIHKEGFLFLVYALIIILLLILTSFFLFSNLISFFVSIFLIMFYVFIIFFFRNPKRHFQDKNRDQKIVLSPADGKIVEIQNIFETEFLKKNCICISIFMSPFNVHVNRFPVSGKVIYTKYHPGKYFIAWLKKSSSNNERTTVVVETSNGKKILFRQIAGFLARRIILYAKKNSIVKKGEEFGFIKFGSRVDIFLPLNSVILVKKGEKVSGGETRISIIP
ncbi:phosphatidylserine decarboxylase [Blattabacterium sp. (Blattella germanica) str. Bge]|uniref:phosphatidylserine decarboxylase family protein n=1 Tax=Blattabacterium sp. (Blattella germanica) TaxID=624186 RepID=UPI0001BB612C|nr:phosphatidylserine decarboxylase family protein [Blattabacterium sp. (Blattella germanica)]ACY40246.1 phosphatidylserine decarboxylase [Blattabacterium sp. (Blattella germanica) str. Bge]